MDGLQFIDSLDSLWFFSNVLSPATELLVHASDEFAVNEEPEKTTSKVEEKQQIETPRSQNLGRRCSICGEFEAELEPQVEHLQSVGMEIPAEVTEPEEKRKSGRSRRRRRRSRRSLPERRQILGELYLGFDRNLGYDKYSSSWFSEETVTSGYQMFGSQLHHNMNMKMPPLNDGMAMKKHLKSWAYAVACTVK